MFSTDLYRHQEGLARAMAYMTFSLTGAAAGAETVLLLIIG
jgi:hypothetical protein